MKYKISVIIPVYNAEKYLNQMLDSVSAQTLREIEILCVDDGSTDSSHAILEKFAERDCRVHIITEDNRGAGAARNAGIEQAEGEYLSFLDADDFFEPKMLERTYEEAKKADADMAVFRSNLYNDSTGLTVPARWTVRKRLLPDHMPFSGEEIKEDRFNLFISWSWDKIYKRSFVEENLLRFQELRNDEDTLFVMPAVARAERIVVVDEVFAHHRKYSQSLSRTREAGWDCMYKSLLAVRERLKEWGIYESWEKDFINNALHCLLRVLNRISGEAHRKMYGKMKTEWLAELGILDRDSDYFYSQWEYLQMRHILRFSPEEFLFWQRDELREQLIEAEGDSESPNQEENDRD